MHEACYIATPPSRGQDYKEKHKTRLKTNVKRTVLNNTVTSFLSTDCELSTNPCSKNVYNLGPRFILKFFHIFRMEGLKKLPKIGRYSTLSEDFAVLKMLYFFYFRWPWPSLRSDSSWSRTWSVSSLYRQS